MTILKGYEARLAEKQFSEAVKLAKQSTCFRSHCGSVIVYCDKVWGRGFNSPPGGLTSQCRCLIDKSSYHNKVTDKTCCVHAEERAILNTLRLNFGCVFSESRYFTRIDEHGKIKKSGRPYCTICSKLILDVGIAEIALWHREGICIYSAEEYNDLSFQYSE